jgi:pyridoxal phosphate enzyme (YggS family)
MTDNVTSIADNIAQVRSEIAAACARVGRSIDTVTLIAVSKTHPREDVIAAAQAGITHFGENRVEEAESKIPAVNAALAVPPAWHMIGHIQSRKARLVLPLFDVAHSVDSFKVAEKLARHAEEMDRTLDIFLEVNVSGEESKEGLAGIGWEDQADVRAALWPICQQILALPGLNVRGLMTMAPYEAEPEETRPVFRSLARLRDALRSDLGAALPDLSMGMTNDYAVAIEEGATLVRVGRAIFGERPAR